MIFEIFKDLGPEVQRTYH